MRRKWVGGNWKMHGSRAMASALASAIVEAKIGAVDVALFPPFPYLREVCAECAGSSVAVGGQDLSEHESGAFTGEVSAAMLGDIGCTYVLAGHSERRQYHHESSQRIAVKVARALSHNLFPVLCVGETLEEHDAGRTAEVVSGQLAPVVTHCGIAAFERIVVAYEPVWAIGTGRTASPAQAQEVHALLRSQLARDDARIAGSIRIVYGGSVKPGNSAELFAQPDIDGGLIGGASLQATDFLSICAAAG
ncbi:MAG TPA: triose-phosphate isomerase [Rhodanobacteraceae bacterium]|jgi:triosephosphate isomerase|nr:triose-phosphate isomerase [Rhodanobacteraceae bacterium]